MLVSSMEKGCKSGIKQCESKGIQKRPKSCFSFSSPSVRDVACERERAENWYQSSTPILSFYLPPSISSRGPLIFSIDIHACSPLNSRPSSPFCFRVSRLPPIPRHPNRTKQPKERIHQINPNGILHSLYPLVPLCILLDIHAAKQTE